MGERDPARPARVELHPQRGAVPARSGRLLLRGDPLQARRFHSLPLSHRELGQDLEAHRWKDRVLLGTTEVRQSIDEPIACSKEEASYLLDAFNGYFDFYWDREDGKIWLAIERFDEDFLYVNWLSRGLGSNPVGLDRAQLGGTRVVRFERIGPKVLLREPNLAYRALTQDQREVQAVEESFASSVLWGAKIEAEGDGKVLVDATPFLVRDSQGVIETLKRLNQGDYKLDESRSTVLLDGTKAFPQNSEFEALLTFTGSKPGRISVSRSALGAGPIE